MEPVNDNHQDLVDYISDRLTDICESVGIEETASVLIIRAIQKDVRENYGGERHYVPVPDKRLRNIRLIKQWKDGTKKQDLCRIFDLEISTVNRIISIYLQGLKPHNQGFGSDDWNL